MAKTINKLIAKFSNTVLGKMVTVNGNEIWCDTLDKDGNKQYSVSLKAISQPGADFPTILSAQRLSNLLVQMPNLNITPNVDYRLSKSGTFDPKMCAEKNLPEGDWAIYVPETPEVAI